MTVSPLISIGIAHQHTRVLTPDRERAARGATSKEPVVQCPAFGRKCNIGTHESVRLV